MLLSYSLKSHAEKFVQKTGQKWFGTFKLEKPGSCIEEAEINKYVKAMLSSRSELNGWSRASNKEYPRLSNGFVLFCELINDKI